MIIALAWLAVGWMPDAARRTQRFTGAAAETWAPALVPGQLPDLTMIRDEANRLMSQTHYEEALQRQIWYFNHALDYDPSLAGVRLSFTLSDWVELGRRYPKARQAMEAIRDHDWNIFKEGLRYPRWVREVFDGFPGFSQVEKRDRSALFQDIYSLNSYLGTDESNQLLVKTLVARDPQLAQHLGYRVHEDAFDALVKKSAHGVGPADLGDGQPAFGAICQQWMALKKEEVRLGKINTHVQAKMNDSWAQRGLAAPAALSAMSPPKAADRIFVDKTRQLIEILVANGHIADAENIRDQALALLDDAWLKSAVSDAEKKTQPSSTAAGKP